MIQHPAWLMQEDREEKERAESGASPIFGGQNFLATNLPNAQRATACNHAPTTTEPKNRTPLLLPPPKILSTASISLHSLGQTRRTLS